jgi:hypothetical protein
MRCHPFLLSIGLKRPTHAPAIKKWGLAAGALLLALLCGAAQSQTSAKAGNPPAPTSSSPASGAKDGPSAGAIGGPTAGPDIRPGQSVLDFALEHAPAGVTLEQFALALVQQNPQAFSAGQQQLSSLQMPTAEQASRIPAEQARAQLLALQSAAAAIQAPEGAPPGQAAAHASPNAAAPDAASGPGATRAIPAMVWVVCGAALLVILGLLLRRTRYETPDKPGAATSRSRRTRAAQEIEPRAGSVAPHSPSPRSTARTAEISTEAPNASTEPGPPSRYRPALPASSEPTTPQHTKPAASDSAPALKPLSERADLPSLDLPSLDLPSLDDLKAPSTGPAPRTGAPARPLDFSGLDLDLGGPDRSKP